MRRNTHICIFVELVSSNEVDGEDQFYIILLCLFDKGSNLFRTGLVEKGVSNLGNSVSDHALSKITRRTHRHMVQCLCERERHATADNKRVNLFKEAQKPKR